MIVYNVTVTLSSQIATEWVSWILHEHAQEVLDTKCFHKYELYEILEHQEDDSKTYAVKYYTDDIKSYEDYVENHANRLRDKGFERFGNQFIAFRTLMKLIQ